MRQVLANCTASISELKRSPTALLSESAGSPIAILNHNKPAAYLVPAETWESVMEYLDDLQLAELIDKRRKDKGKAVRVDIDDL